MPLPDQSIFPFPEPYIRDYAEKLFRIVSRGECATSVWVATAGRRVVNRFIVNHQDLFTKELPDQKRFVLVYIEPLDLTEETAQGYLRLIGKDLLQACQKKENCQAEFEGGEIEIFDNEQAPYSKLLEALKTVVAKIVNQDLEVALFLGEFDELSFINPTFSNNLRSLWNRFDSKLHLVFLIKDTRLIFDQNHFGEELGYLFFQNIFYALVSKSNEDYLLDYFVKKMERELTGSEKDLLAQLCDGHPYFLKLAVETLTKAAPSVAKGDIKELEEAIRSNYEIRATSDRMLEVFTDPMKKFLGDIATKQIYQLPTNESLTALLSLGVVRKHPDGYYQVFCSLFRDAILKKALPEIATSSEGQKNLYFDETANTIIISGKPVDEFLTRQEYEILAYFLKQPNKLHSRDAIAEAIWGKESYEKYSDWAIDQLMSKLRKKLEKLGADGKTLVTVRGRGYKFIY